MHTKMVWGAVAALAMLAAAATAHAAPIDFKNVASDAVWLAHLDVDAATASKVVRTVFMECFAGHPHEELGELFERIGLDVHKDVHGITLYGPKIALGRGVMIVNAKFNVETVLRRMKKAPDADTFDYRDYHIHTWTKYRWTRFPHEVGAAFYKPDMLVLGSNVDLVKSALDVLDGHSASLAGKDSPLTAQVPAGAVVVARAVGVDRADLRGHFSVAKLIKQISYAAGEREGHWFKEGTIVTVSPQTADKLKQVVEGHRAFAALRFHDQPAVLALLDDLKISVDGSTLKLSFSAPVDKVLAAVPIICQAVREHTAWHERMFHERMRRIERWHHWREHEEREEHEPMEH